jgi:tetratricopeptide (TPR) repeat protein
LPSSSTKPQIAVYAICKNEETFIERFYRSIENADFISIVDTGSTDSTFDQLVSLVKERAKQYGQDLKIETYESKIRNASEGSMQVHRALVDPWRFDDARNIALNLLPKDPDVCISIDIDELLEPGWKDILSRAILEDLHTLGRPADRYHHRFSTIWNWQYPDQPSNFTDHWHERIHSRKGYHWKLPVHEILVKDGPEEVRWLSDFRIIQKPDIGKSRSSYLPLLEQSLKEDPNRWKSWSFYAGDLQGTGRFQEAIDAINKAKLSPDADQAYLCFQASTNYTQISDTQKAISEMLQAVSSSNNREYRVHLAQLYRGLNKPREALNAILMASEITQRTYGYSYDPNCWGPPFDKLVEQITAECNEP